MTIGSSALPAVIDLRKAEGPVEGREATVGAGIGVVDNLRAGAGGLCGVAADELPTVDRGDGKGGRGRGTALSLGVGVRYS